jgi:DNA-binding CsgD family transcriptional regulator
MGPDESREAGGESFALRDVPNILFQAIARTIEDPFRILDTDYRLLWINRSELRQKVGRICYESVYGRSEPCPDCPVTAAFEMGRPSTVERLVTGPDGEQTWREIRAYPVFDESSNVVYAITIGHDVDEERADAVRQRGYIEALERALYDVARSGAPTPIEDVGEPPRANLSKREFEVLRLMAAGLTNAEISNVLSISSHTVKTYVVRIFDKLGVSDRTQAATLATRLRLI